MGCTEDSCEGSAGFAAGGHLGGFVARRLALVASVSVIVANQEVPGYARVKNTRSVIGVGVRFWATPRLWLEAGMGRASVSSASNGGSGESEHVASLFGGFGYEVRRTTAVVLDVRFRGGVESYGDVEYAANSFELGFSWF